MEHTSDHPVGETCPDCLPKSGPSSPTRPLNTTQGDISPPVILCPRVTIEFCDRCRWAPRATWIQTELFLTFSTPILKSITLIPLNSPETGGRFRVWLELNGGIELVWDRKTEGGFPELKVLKQRMRDIIQPGVSLGHSDGVHSTDK
ncbi:hypothetical protein TREMEDRAFT_35212 [Tremella mesenterica DSM 1558]|uniref:uncharacterized protein n=1 Tax=Tremella mesenterica (strain ATCC 24925 / CBS 8224 / DSM 1558 / NBRC 9311 / NRRL Y-6157 / RJB 2259-6 / UBC 559-6) TaxID=578456 RepID=UPI00032BBDAB|nr:uncharacterized protein TREMEDRAFT_35212 [Tremella mesenterica DSM 1558]EIW66345.1 hypothetical protein TREMEDRAFT_35212 [Tremella mesenterica DSM 1558]